MTILNVLFLFNRSLFVVVVVVLYSFQDQEIPCDEINIFYNSSVLTTSGYLARAVVNNIITGSILNQAKCKVTDYNCPVQ